MKRQGNQRFAKLGRSFRLKKEGCFENYIEVSTKLNEHDYYTLVRYCREFKRKKAQIIEEGIKLALKKYQKELLSQSIEERILKDD